MTFSLEQLTLIGMIAAGLLYAVYFIWYMANQNFRLKTLEDWKELHNENLNGFGALKANMQAMVDSVNRLCTDMQDWKKETSRVYEKIFEKIDEKQDKE